MIDRAEKAGFGVAVVGHVALFAALTLGLANWEPPVAGSDAIEVSFVDEVGLVAAAPQLSQEPPAQGVAPTLGAPDDSAAALPEPAQAVPQPQRPTPQPVPRAEQPVQERPTPAQPRTTGTGEQARRPRIGDEILDGIGADPSASRSQRPPATMTGEARASINAAIRRALIPCERQPLPSPQAAVIEVDVRVTLNRNGSLAEATVLRVRNSNSGVQIYERRMRDLALNVIHRCTPIRGLPDELYDVPRGWRQFTYTFDPRQG